MKVKTESDDGQLAFVVREDDPGRVYVYTDRGDYFNISVTELAKMVRTVLAAAQ